MRRSSRSSTPGVWHDLSPFIWVQTTGNNSPGPVWLTHLWKGITQVYRAATSNQHMLKTTPYPMTGKVIPEDWKVVQRIVRMGMFLPTRSRAATNFSLTLWKQSRLCLSSTSILSQQQSGDVVQIGSIRREVPSMRFHCFAVWDLLACGFNRYYPTSTKSFARTVAEAEDPMVVIVYIR